MTKESMIAHETIIPRTILPQLPAVEVVRPTETVQADARPLPLHTTDQLEAKPDRVDSGPASSVAGAGENAALQVRLGQDAERKRTGVRTKTLKTETVPQNMPRLAKAAGAVVLSLVEDARRMRAAKQGADGVVQD